MKARFTITVLGLVMAGAMIAARQADSPRLIFEAARKAEVVDGNLKSAIELYRKVAETADRALAAQALLRMGEAYQKLGDAEARAIFLRLVTEFPDQADVVSAARALLDRSRGAPLDPLPNRLVGVQQGWIDFVGHVSADGRLGGTDWTNGDLILRDLLTGRVTRLVTGGGVGGNVSTWGEDPVVSPDRRQVAYQWFYDESPTDTRHQLRLISLEAGAKPRVLVDDRARIRNPYPIAWSADGRRLLASFEVPVPAGSNQPAGQGDFELVWVSVADGTFERIRTVEWWRSGGLNSLGLVSLSPDGRYLAYSALSAPGSRDRSIYIVGANGAGFTEVAKGGINESPVWSPDGTNVLFVSNRAGAFGVWSLPVRNGEASGLVTLVKGNTGRVALHGFSAAGTLYYTQREGVDEVFVAGIEADGRMSGPRTQPTDSAPGVAPAWSRDGKYLAFKRARGDDSFELVVRSVDTKDEQKWSGLTAAGRPLGGARPTWLGDTIVLAAARSRVQVSAGQQLRELPAPFGLPLGAVSPDGETVYAPGGDTANGGPRSRVVTYDTSSGQEKGSFAVPNGVTALALNRSRTTLALVTRGRVAVVQVDGSNYRELYASPKVHTNPGHVGWSPDDRWVLFVTDNERGNAQLFRVSASGGAPEWTGFEADSLRSFDITPAGPRIAYSTRKNSIEIWAFDVASRLRP